MSRFSRYVARRFLRSTRRDAYVSFLSRTASIGIGLGSGALILALAALSGFQETLKAQVLARTPAVEVEPAAGVDSGAVVARLRESGLTAIRVVRGRGWLIGVGRVRPLELVGYEGRLPDWFPEASSREPGLYVGSRLAAAWRLEAGAPVELASNRPALTPLGPQPRIRRAALAGTFTTGATEEGDLVALPFSEAAGLLGADRAVVQVHVGELAEADTAAARAASVLGSDAARIRTWRDLNRALLFALALEKTVLFIAVFLIAVVAALSLMSGLMLLVASKRREVGMLGAMGAAPRAVRALFVRLGAMLAGLGLAGGAVFGLGAAWALDRYRLVPLPDRVYFVDHVPFVLRPWDLFLIAAGCLALVLACAWRGGRAAAAVDPVEALRR